MRRAWASIVLVLGACTDYSVHVRFDIPDDYRADVEAVTLSVIVPPPAAEFTCDQLAFGEVASETVALATQQEVTATIDDGGTQLADFPRTGTKLFYARGLDAQDLPLVAGCTEVDDVDGSVDVRIDGFPTTVVTVMGQDPGLPLPDSYADNDVRVVDARGEPLSDAEVHFWVFGPGSEPSTGTAMANNRGEVTFTIVPPALPGPQALDIRARWSRTAPESVLGFGQPPVLAEVDLPGDEADLPSSNIDSLHVVGAIGPSGQPGFASLGRIDDIGGGRQALLAWYDAGEDPSLVTVASPPITGAFALGLVRAPGEDRDRVFTITGTQWIEVTTSGTLDSRAAPAPGRPATRIVPAGECDGSDSEVVLVSYTDDSLALYDVDGEPVDAPLIGQEVPTGARIAGSGCVSATSDTGLHRTVAFTSDGPQLDIVTDLDGGRHGKLSALAQGIGFAPALGGEAHLLASEVDIDGVRMGRWRLAPLGPSALELEQVTDDGSTAPPASTAGGDVDLDGQPDVAAVIAFGERDDITLFRIRITLATDHFGDRLSGLSSAVPIARPRLFLHDLDSDGVDDIILASPDRVLIYDMGP
jgi:hypothetical protein